MTDTLGSSAREKMLARLRALASKTIENGCTEAEALAAAEKLAEMMEAYDVSQDEIEFRASEFRKETYQDLDEVGIRLQKLTSTIAALTGVKNWITSCESRYVFFGRDSDVAIAGYMMAICDRAIRTETARYDTACRLYRPDKRKRMRWAFIDGMARRLTQRIDELRRARDARKTKGTGLVVLKRELVDAELNKMGMKFQDTGPRRERDHDPAFEAGKRAADRVSLNDGLGGSAGSEAIAAATG